MKLLIEVSHSCCYIQIIVLFVVVLCFHFSYLKTCAAKKLNVQPFQQESSAIIVCDSWCTVPLISSRCNHEVTITTHRIRLNILNTYIIIDLKFEFNNNMQLIFWNLILLYILICEHWSLNTIRECVLIIWERLCFIFVSKVSFHCCFHFTGLSVAA